MRSLVRRRCLDCLRFFILQSLKAWDEPSFGDARSASYKADYGKSCATCAPDAIQECTTCTTWLPIVAAHERNAGDCRQVADIGLAVEAAGHEVPRLSP